MASSEPPTNGQRLQDALRLEQVFYQTYPDVTGQPRGVRFNWFEIALHVKTEDFHPPNDSRYRAQFSTLIELAEFLVQQVRSHAPYQVELSSAYHTLHPPQNNSAPMLTRSLGLLFAHVSPYSRDEEPAILADLKTSLRCLGIPRIEAAQRRTMHPHRLGEHDGAV